MAAELFTTPARADDADGAPYSGAKWYFYATGGNTPQAVYADAGLITSLGSSVTADGGGKFPAIFLDASKIYRGVLKNSDGSVTVYDIDPLNISSVPIPLYSVSATASAGQTAFAVPVTAFLDSVVVYLNGVRLAAADFSLSGGFAILPPRTAGDTVTIDAIVHQEVAVGDSGSVTFSHAGSYAQGSAGAKLQQLANPLDAPYSATGTGVTDDRAALLSAAAAGTGLQITGNHRVSSDLTIAVPVWFSAAGRLTIDGGATVTFSSSVLAGSHRVFYGTGAIAGLSSVDAAWLCAADAIVDDTANLQKAVTCVGGTGGGIVTLPAKTIKLTAAVSVSNPNVNIRGAGRRATKLYQTTASAAVLSVTGDYFRLFGTGIEYASQGTTGGTGIDINGPSYSALEDVNVYKADIGVQYRGGATSHTGTSVKVEDATTNNVLVSHAFDVLWDDTCQLLNSNTTTLATLGCLRLYGQTEGCTFQCQTYQGVYALTMDASAFTFGSRPSYNKFIGAYFDGSASGAQVDKSVETDFDNCWFSARPGNGLYLVQVDGVRVIGGQAINCGANGILVDAQAKRVTIAGFAPRSNSVASSGTYSGICVSADTTDFSITGCQGTNTELSFGTQKYAIEVKAGASDRYIVADNLVTGNGTGGVSDGGTGVNKRVANNY